MTKQKSLDNFVKEVTLGDLIRFEVRGSDFTTGEDIITEYTGYSWGSPQITFPELNRFHHSIQGVDYVIGNVPPKSIPSKFPLTLIPIHIRNRCIGELYILSYEVLNTKESKLSETNISAGYKPGNLS